ncbi:hypothetical protein BST83_16995 [Polaribacter filamentus]|uniref:YdhG-like domain-containing protein n=1 Tax=Polaribacter filamentus TaxID=53483 RepID=A0A2S7KKC2_9FLAO|nr:hypothetical protein [Polaribacter filamentus]PQB03033.1 hypothetical protein BST83_16995 [Polaribacter filamentus]
MPYEANTPEEYIAQLPADRKIAVEKLRIVLKKDLPKGFKGSINYKMLGHYIPDSKYLNGCHGKRKLEIGKNCIQFKKMDEIPYDLTGELASKITINQWVRLHETTLKKATN